MGAEVLPFGLGISQGAFMMHQYGAEYATFVAPPERPGGTDTGVGELRAAVGVFDDLGLDRIDVLVLNIEGYEWTLLPYLLDLGQFSSGRIRRLVLQTHADERDWQFGQIAREIEQTHKRVFDELPAWGLWGMEWRMNEWDARSLEWDDLPADAVIVEVGGYEGRWLEGMLDRYPGQYIVYGAAVVVLDRLRARVLAKPLEDRSVQFLPYGLGTHQQIVEIGGYHTDAASILKTPEWYARHPGEGRRERSMITLQSVAQELTMPRIDVLCMNIEGDQLRPARDGAAGRHAPHPQPHGAVPRGLRRALRRGGRAAHAGRDARRNLGLPGAHRVDAAPARGGRGLVPQGSHIPDVAAGLDDLGDGGIRQVVRAQYRDLPVVRLGDHPSACRRRRDCLPHRDPPELPHALRAQAVRASHARRLLARSGHGIVGARPGVRVVGLAQPRRQPPPARVDADRRRHDGGVGVDAQHAAGGTRCATSGW